MQRLCIKVAKLFALLFYHGIQSEGRFTFQVTHALMQLCNVGSACKTIDVVHSYRHIFATFLCLLSQPNFKTKHGGVIPKRLVAKGGKIL